MPNSLLRGPDILFDNTLILLNNKMDICGCSKTQFPLINSRIGNVHLKTVSGSRIIDKKEVYLGSQNFDWRSLTHIQELGVHITHPKITQVFVDVFEMDWEIASGHTDSLPKPTIQGKEFPVAVEFEGEEVQVTPVVSPKEWLPHPDLWDLPLMLEMISGAQKTIKIQLLNYKTVNYDKSTFFELDKVIRAAAKRGVKVEMLLSDWSKKPRTIKALKELQEYENITVKLVTIPAWSGGFIPFSRVIHSKYLIVDGQKTWIGTSNWSGDYFYQSRNVGLIMDGPKVAEKVKQVFMLIWNSDYSYEVDPFVDYVPPRIKE